MIPISSPDFVKAQSEYSATRLRSMFRGTASGRARSGGARFGPSGFRRTRRLPVPAAAGPVVVDLRTAAPEPVTSEPANAA